MNDHEFREKRRRELGFALVSRVLTPEEMSEVAEMGPNLYVERMVAFNPTDKRHEFNDALLRQFQMRIIAESKWKA